MKRTHDAAQQALGLQLDLIAVEAQQVLEIQRHLWTLDEPSVIASHR
jgi:hypothetical protein